MKTTREILEEIDRRGISLTASRLAGGCNDHSWGVRISTTNEFDRRQTREGATFDAALLAAWVAYLDERGE